MDRAAYFRLGSQLAAGAILGALAYVALDLLGVPGVLHIGTFNGFWICAILGAAVYPSRFRSVGWGTLGLLVLTIGVVGYTPVIVGPTRALVRADPPSPVDAVVALASGVNDDGLVSSNAVDRLLTAFAVARVGGQRDPLPLVLTVVRQERPPFRSSRVDQEHIARLAGDGAYVFWTDTIYSTHDEARAVAALMRAQQWAAIAVVTSPTHTRRACATFEKMAIAVRCVPARSRELAIRSLRNPRDRLWAFRLWMYETAGSLDYRRRGWI